MYGFRRILIFTTNTHPCHRTERVMVGWWGTCSSGHILWFAKVRVTGRVLYPTLPYLRHTCTNWCPITPQTINYISLKSWICKELWHCLCFCAFIPYSRHSCNSSCSRFKKKSLIIKVSAYRMPNTIASEAQ